MGPPTIAIAFVDKSTERGVGDVRCIGGPILATGGSFLIAQLQPLKHSSGITVPSMDFSETIGARSLDHSYNEQWNVTTPVKPSQLRVDCLKTTNSKTNLTFTIFE
jgi:hypothetical protein